MFKFKSGTHGLSEELGRHSGKEDKMECSLFESLDKDEKSSYVLGSELWESKFDGLLSLVKEYGYRRVGNTKI